MPSPTARSGHHSRHSCRTAQGGARELSYAESKYLGGDSSHTHLVKGLDYALLHKMRAEEGRQAPATEGTAGSGSESEDEPRAPTALRPRRLAARAARSPLAAAVHEFLLGSGAAAAAATAARQDRVDLFQPQRMSFEYDLEAHGALLPTATVRAKEDCPKVVFSDRRGSVDVWW